jgi:hypothetical protein
VYTEESAIPPITGCPPTESTSLFSGACAPFRGVKSVSFSIGRFVVELVPGVVVTDGTEARAPGEGLGVVLEPLTLFTATPALAPMTPRAAKTPINCHMWSGIRNSFSLSAKPGRVLVGFTSICLLFRAWVRG